MTNDDWLSRKFWERIMGIICLLMLVMAFPILHYTSILSTALLPALENVPVWIVSVLLIGIWYKAYMGMSKELDRRFPPYDKNGDYLQRMQGEINHNYKRDHS